MATPTTYRQILRTLVRMAKHQGWNVTMTSNGHWSFVNPAGQIVITGSTPSDHRSLKNLESRLKAIGLDTSTDRRGRRKRPYHPPADPLEGYVSPLESAVPQDADPEPIDDEAALDEGDLVEIEIPDEFPEVIPQKAKRSGPKKVEGLEKYRRIQAKCKANPGHYFKIEDDVHKGWVAYRRRYQRDVWGDKRWLFYTQQLADTDRMMVAICWQPNPGE